MNYGEVKRQFEFVLHNHAAPGDMTDGWMYRGMVRIQRELRLPFMQRYLVTQVGSSFTHVGKPRDYLRFRTLLCDNMPLESVGIDRLFALRGTTHQPRYYHALHDRFIFAGTPQAGSEITLVYYGEMQRPVLDTDENELTRLMPDLMLFAALIEAGTDMLEDSPIVNLWGARYSEIAQNIQNQADEEAYEGQMTVEAPWGEY